MLNMAQLSAEQKMQRIFFLLPEVMKRLFQNNSFEYDISHSQCKVLHVVGYRKKLTMSELSDLLNIEMSSATALVDSLVGLGIIERNRSEKDRRVVQVELTKKGQDKFKDYALQVKKSIAGLFSKMNDEQQNCIVGAFEQLYNVLVEVKK